MTTLPRLTVADAHALIAARRVVVAYPRKGIVVVDGFKRHPATPAALAAAKRNLKEPS